MTKVRLQILESVDSWCIWNPKLVGSPGCMRSHGEYCIYLWKWHLQNHSHVHPLTKVTYPSAIKHGKLENTQTNDDL